MNAVVGELAKKHETIKFLNVRAPLRVAHRRRHHGISPVFTGHYQDLGYKSEISVASSHAQQGN